VCQVKTGHTVQRRSRKRVPWEARLHDYHTGNRPNKRGAAKEVRFVGFRPDGDGERRADHHHGGERDEVHEVASRVKSEEFTVLQPRSI